MLDPERKVAGSGVEQLRAAGIAVTAGDGEAEPRRLLEAYLKHRRTGLPFVIAKFAATLDGKIAAASGDSRWVAGDEARAWAHDFRTTIDAIMCGVNNVLLDDPQLTARPDGVRGRAPAAAHRRRLARPHAARREGAWPRRQDADRDDGRVAGELARASRGARRRGCGAARRCEMAASICAR